jgi:hypothetical protein
MPSFSPLEVSCSLRLLPVQVEQERESRSYALDEKKMRKAALKIMLSETTLGVVGKRRRRP